MCTAIKFEDPQGNMYFGRNLDWSCGYGESIVAIPAGYTRKMAFDVPAPTNTPAIIGMGIVAADTPLMFDCANEHGLAVAGLNFPGFAQYETAPQPGKTNIAPYELPWWVCANFKTAAQAAAALENVALVAAAPTPDLGVSMLHWFIADATHAFTIEQTAAGMRVTPNAPAVLTNQPTFAWHTENLRNFAHLTPAMPAASTWADETLAPYGAGFGMRGLPGDYTSPSRFVRAAYHNAHYPSQQTEPQNVTRAFKTLGAASMVKGGAIMPNGDTEYTVYTGVFSARTQTYYYQTYDNPALQQASLQTVFANNPAGQIVVVA
jgi:choloylglycine hydrolase